MVSQFLMSSLMAGFETFDQNFKVIGNKPHAIRLLSKWFSYRTSLEYGRNTGSLIENRREVFLRMHNIRPSVITSCMLDGIYVKECEYQIDMKTWKDLRSLEYLINHMNKEQIPIKDENVTQIHVDCLDVQQKAIDLGKSLPKAMEAFSNKAWATYLQHEDFFDEISMYEGSGNNDKESDLHWSESISYERYESGTQHRCSKLNCTMSRHPTIEFRFWYTHSDWSEILIQIFMSIYFIRCCKNNTEFKGRKFYDFLRTCQDHSRFMTQDRPKGLFTV